jgi:hypothetical protein
MRCVGTMRILLCALLLTSCGAAAPFAQQGTTPFPTPPSPPMRPALTSIPDGTYVVGVDISPGRWHTDGPRMIRTYGVVEAESRCGFRLGWPEVKDGVHTMEEIFRKDDSGPADLVLGPYGATFETKGCKAWQRD